MPDRRKSARRRTYFGGRISVDRIETFDVGCTVRNIGQGGARLVLQQPTLVPSTFRLGISGGPGRRGRLVWYRGGEMGIAFADAQGIDAQGIDAQDAGMQDPGMQDPGMLDAEPASTAADLALPAAPLQVRMQAIMARRRAASAGFTRP